MTDLRRAAETVLKELDGLYPFDTPSKKALRQALAQPEKEFVGACVTCGAPKSEWLVDAVNMSQERVDETAKRKHEPVCSHGIGKSKCDFCKPLEQEPVAWRSWNDHYGYGFWETKQEAEPWCSPDFFAEPLYTAPVDAVNTSQERVDEMVKGGHEYVIDCPRCGHCCPNVHAVNMSQERVVETAKCKHEPWPSVQCVCGGTIYFKYTPPVSDYHEGWEEGFKAATREQEPFIYVREDNEKPFGGYEHCSEADAGAFPVYTAPPKREWVGLTDEEMRRLKQKSVDDGMTRVVSDFEYIRSIEAKLKEKNA